MICPECKHEVDDGALICDNCGFDLQMFRISFERIYSEKLNEYTKKELEKNQPHVVKVTNTINKPQCPYCGSTDLKRITSMDKAINIAMFGLLGNKRKYQWHCNNCKTNW